MSLLDTRQATPESRPESAVLDTNAVLAWQYFHDPDVLPMAQALASGRLRWVGTQRMLGELAHVARGLPAMGTWQGNQEPRGGIDVHLCMIFPEPQAPPARRVWCSDPDDQVFIDLALCLPARWLFTRDKALLKLARKAARQGVQVLRPEDWQP